MQPYNRHNTTPKCKHVRKCKAHQPIEVKQPKVSALVIVFDKARAKMSISKPAKQGLHYELSIFSV